MEALNHNQGTMGIRLLGPDPKLKLDGIAELSAAMDELTSFERDSLAELMPSPPQWRR